MLIGVIAFCAGVESLIGSAESNDSMSGFMGLVICFLCIYGIGSFVYFIVLLSHSSKLNTTLNNFFVCIFKTNQMKKQT